MSILIKGMEMPKDCPMCPMSHWDMGNNFRGCEIVSGKKHAIRDPEYANSNHRPNWCPLVPVPPHGRLRRRIVYRGEVYNALESARVNALNGILSDPYKEGFHDGIKRAIQILANEVDDAPTIIEAEEGE